MPRLVEQPPAVVDGEVPRVINLAPYPQASTRPGECFSFTGRYATDPTRPGMAQSAGACDGGGDPVVPLSLPQEKTPEAARPRPNSAVRRAGSQLVAWTGFVFGSIMSIAANVLDAWL